MERAPRNVVRYRNRKLYEPKERRFVTIHDLAHTVATGGHVEVLDSDTGANITAKILSRALASEKAAVPASTAAITRILRASSEAAETVADVVERVGGTNMAASMRRVATPERLAETFSPVTRRLEDARQEVERIVARLVGRGSLTWEEGTRLKNDVGAVFRDSLSDVLGRVRDLTARLLPGASAELSREISDLKNRIDQLEALAARTFPHHETAPENEKTKPARRRKTGTPKSAPKGRRKS